jgi:PrtD family type I secretion system ABC transporter
MLQLRTSNGSQQNSPVPQVLREVRRSFWSVALFSAFVNLLMLAGPLYMLQLYDRVLSSRSVPTLIVLSAFLLGAYLFQAILDIIRGRVVVAISGQLDERLDVAVHEAVARGAVKAGPIGEPSQPVRHLDQIRAFLTSGGPVALVDLPWIPAFMAVCFLIHPLLGLVSVAGAVALLVVTKLTERANREPARALSRAQWVRSGLIDETKRNSESVIAMGMLPALSSRWTAINGNYVKATTTAANATGGYASLSRIIRLLLQSAMLGFGAYLVIRQELTAGGMIAASIMMGRALAPLEIAVGNWRSMIAARESLTQLSESLARTIVAPPATSLPRPSQKLQVQDLIIGAPGSRQSIVSRVNFSLSAGDTLAVIGPSGSGKSSLARTLAGVWTPLHGEVCLDGAALDQWGSEAIGKHLGYVAQSVELFSGTVAENIARMARDYDSALVIAAARAAGAHEMILQLPHGYDTPIGEGGAILSAGQRQRVALARALFGTPFLIVLDEPNSNLDQAGENALQQAITNLKQQGAITIVIAHRPGILAACDKILCLSDGVQQAFGPRDEVLAKLVAARRAAAHSNLKVVAEAGASSP